MNDNSLVMNKGCQLDFKISLVSLISSPTPTQPRSDLLHVVDKSPCTYSVHVQFGKNLVYALLFNNQITFKFSLDHKNNAKLKLKYFFFFFFMGKKKNLSTLLLTSL